MRPFRFAGRATAYDYEKALPYLGKEPDKVTARRIGCVRQDIHRLRTQLGIARFDPMDVVLHLLGKVPDARLARHIGLTAATVTKKRKALGIPRADIKQANADLMLRSYVSSLQKELES